MKAYLQEFSSVQTVNYTLPSSFVIEFTINGGANQQYNNTAFLRFNNDSGTYCGKGASASQNINLASTLLNQIPVNTDVEYTLTYDGNGNGVLTDGTDSITVTGLNLTKLWKVDASSKSHIKNVKIKPL